MFSFYEEAYLYVRDENQTSDKNKRQRKLQTSYA